MGGTVQSVHARGEDPKIFKSLTYLGNVEQNKGGSHQEVSRRFGPVYAATDPLNTNIKIMTLSTPVQEDEYPDLNDVSLTCRTV